MSSGKMCSFGVKCTKLTDAKHLASFGHPWYAGPSPDKAEVCFFDETAKCTKLKDSQHRKQFSHPFFETAFATAAIGAWDGNEDDVKAFLDLYADMVCERTHDREQPLIYMAARRGHEKIVDLLLKGGADINQLEGKTKSTALHGASFEGHDKVVAQLLKAGANPKIKNQYDRTPEQESGSAAVKAVFVKFRENSKSNGLAIGTPCPTCSVIVQKKYSAFPPDLKPAWEMKITNFWLSGDPILDHIGRRMRQIEVHFASSLLVVGVSSRKISEAATCFMLIKFIPQEFPDRRSVINGGKFGEPLSLGTRIHVHLKQLCPSNVIESLDKLRILGNKEAHDFHDAERLQDDEKLLCVQHIDILTTYMLDHLVM
eukprot:m.70843 g.70843  ORF g.70843 m.70843 type:complete len:371 (-) comp20112_c0_seq2:44-1156(-)